MSSGNLVPVPEYKSSNIKSNNSYSNSSLYSLDNNKNKKSLALQLGLAILRKRESMMRRSKAPTTLVLVFLCVLLSALYSLHVSRNAVSLVHYPQTLTATATAAAARNFNHLIREQQVDVNHNHTSSSSTDDDQDDPHVSSVVDSVSVLLPNWEVLVLASPSPSPPTPSTSLYYYYYYYCVFPNKEISGANFSGVLPFTNATAFTCILPNRNRRLRPFYQPLLLRAPAAAAAAAASSSSSSAVVPQPPPVVMPRWDLLVYECLSTETDVILFVKGVNNRQGVNRPPEDLSCVFGTINDVDSVNVKTPVTSSMQEVFRCPHPNLTAHTSTSTSITVSLQINNSENLLVIPSVAYYAPPPRRTPTPKKPKSLLCATTMVYNVGKFLREWVMYYSTIGVDKFFLYDNGSDDNLEGVIEDLKAEAGGGYDIERVFWIWPKTQEAGFSHSAVYAKDSCTWMMYVDVDEFIFSPSWLNNNHSNSNSKAKAILPSTLLPNPSTTMIGQVSIKCNEFGPSGQREHPAEGVTQGYTCRRRVEQRHKSILLLDAIDDSLVNAIHHFGLNKSKGYGWKEVGVEVAVVNHYKYQAWPEFANKFRRRVSAFVADWRSGVNPNSKDRTPGLGSRPLKPQAWETMFCELQDQRLQLLTQAWFASQSQTPPFKMAWQL